MTTTTRLTELQSLLLAHARRNDRHAFEPLPDKLRDQEARVRPCLQALVKRGLAEVHTVLDEDGEPAIVEVLATTAGLEAIGCDISDPLGAAHHTTAEASCKNETADTPLPAAMAISASSTAKPGSRTAQLLELLARDGGATITALAEATGTLPHSVRAALTGLRKKGHTVASIKVDGERRYSVASGQ